MTGRAHYSPAALDRVRSVGEAALLEYLDDVSPKAISLLAGLLPPVKGFRKASKPGIQQGKRVLWQKLRSSASASKDRVDFALYAFWRNWAEEQLGDPAGTVALLDAVEEVCDEDDAKRRQSELDLFAALKARSLANQCSREKIERFFTFSPFDESREIRSLIEGAKPAADISRESVMTELPQRLARDEQDIKSIEVRLRTLLEHVDASSTDAQQLRKEVAALASEAGRLAKDNKEVRSILDTHTAALQSTAELVANRARDFSARSDALNDRLSLLASALDSVMQALARREADHSIAEWMESVDRRIAALETKETPPAQEPLRDDDRIIQRVEAPPAPIRVQAFRAAASEAPRSFNGLADAIAALAANLEAIGLKKTAAQSLAEEICAAAMVGQVVFLKGGRATEAARISARTLGGRHSFRVSMPIGLLDGEQLASAVGEALAGGGDAVAALAIEGVNRSGLDVFADVLSDTVVGAHAARGVPLTPTFVLAGITQGTATLPIEPRYLELGPIFDLDHLDWRLRVPTRAEPIIGTFSLSVLGSIRHGLGAKPADPDEPLRLVRKFASARNPRIESVIVAAYTALTSTERRQKSVSPLQSLAFGWLVPFWAALGVTREDADSELDGGKCDSATPDPRLTSILEGADLTPGKAEQP